MEEIWKPVVGFEGLYEVSNLGSIRSLPHDTLIQRKKGLPYTLRKPGAILKPQTRGNGYLSVWLYGNCHNNGRAGKAYSVHRIVAEAFCEKKDGACEVNHLNENKQDNRACNLEWCSHKENSTFGTKAERTAKANLNGKRSRKIAQYTRDGVLVRIYLSLHDADRNGYSASNIFNCANGHPNYSHAYGYLWRFVD